MGARGPPGCGTCLSLAPAEGSSDGPSADCGIRNAYSIRRARPSGGLGIHLLAGLPWVLTGLAAMLARKGPGRHSYCGQIRRPEPEVMYPLAVPFAVTNDLAQTGAG
jgi:hypothetical protein